MPETIRKNLFVGREKEIGIFEKALTEKFGTSDVGDESAEPKVLVFYGVAGIGKTSLCDELSQKVLQKSFKYAAWCKVDFRTKTYTDPETGLFHIRNELSAKHNMKFPAFDIAYGIYWKKANPQKGLDESTFAAWGNSELLTDVVGTLTETPVVGWIPKVGKLLEKGFRHWANNKTKKSKEILQGLPAKEAHEIMDLLPELLAEDITLNFAKDNPEQKAIDSQPTIIFFDTYEELWGKEKEDFTQPSLDKWVMKLAEACRHALIVITGRRELKWEKRDGFWDDNRLEQHKVIGLEKDKANEYLVENEITDKAIQDKIYTGSEGVPFYLDLSIDTYNSILDKDATPTVDDFGGTYKEVLERFCRNINANHLKALKVLSAARFWNDEVFDLLGKAFPKKFSAVEITDLRHYSFITKDEDDRYRMHDLMRQHLQGFCKKNDDEPFEDVHKVLFVHYAQRLIDLKPIDVSDKHKRDFHEAFFHAPTLLPVDDFADWAMITLTVFKDAAQWNYAEKYLYELIGVIEDKAGDTRMHLATVLNNIALMYKSQGRHDEAVPLYEYVVEVFEDVLGENDALYATSLNNLAMSFISQCRYHEAEPLIKRAIEIGKNTLGENHPYYATWLNNLAGLYRTQGCYDKAEPLFKKVILLFESALGKNHQNYAMSVDNLAYLYDLQGRYQEAEPLYRQAIEIEKKTLGEKHPDFATSLNNLAALYFSTGRYDKAELLSKQALSIVENALGELHPYVIIILENMAILYHEMGQEGKAREYSLRADDLQKKRDAQQS